MLHELKLERQFADAVFEGRKTFDVRRNDRGYQAGDYVKFSVPKRYYENNEYTHSPSAHRIEDCLYLITYVLSGWGISPEFVVLGIQPVADEKVKRMVERSVNAELKEPTREKGFIFGRSS